MAAKDGNGKNAPPAARGSGSDRGAIREELRAFRKDRILYEAAELFYERGYTGTTLDAIAERLEVTKPFIYYYCQNKLELLVDICDRMLDLTMDAVTRSLAVKGTPGERLEAFVRNFVRTQIENQRLVGVFFREERNLPDDMRRRIDAVRGEFDEKLAEILDEGVAAGAFDIDDTRLASLAIGGMMAWTFTWYMPGGRLEVDDICDRMVPLVERMVRPAGSGGG